MLRFGAIEFDGVTRRVRRDGEAVHLPPKAFELLAILADAAPRVVPKRELHARLWPGGMVADATLVALVKQLRNALADRDRKSPLIRTVHRIGYALDSRPVPDPGVGELAHDCCLLRGPQRYPLEPGENLVGRDALAKVRLDDPSVSRRHARIVLNGASAQIEDLGSKNGTFVEGACLRSGTRPLLAGNRIAFGTLELRFHDANQAATLTHFGGT